MSNNNEDEDDKIKKLLEDAHGTGALSAKSLATLDIVDVGAQIQAGLGCTVDDVTASEVVLVTMMPDDSQSIAQANNTDAVRDRSIGSPRESRASRSTSATKMATRAAATTSVA